MDGRGAECEVLTCCSISSVELSLCWCSSRELSRSLIFTPWASTWSVRTLTCVCVWKGGETQSHQQAAILQHFWHPPFNVVNPLYLCSCFIPTLSFSLPGCILYSSRPGKLSNPTIHMHFLKVIKITSLCLPSISQHISSLIDET